MTEPKPTPDLVEEIVGFRAWRFELGSILRPEPRLYSLTNDFRWPTNAWTIAKCRTCKDIPGEKCSCGIYAARDREHLWEIGYGQAENQVIGEIGLAGKVVVGELGWRAAKARPRRLYISYARWQLVRPLREAFNIPVILTNTTRSPV